MEHDLVALLGGRAIQHPRARDYSLTDVEENDAAEFHSLRRVHCQRQYAIAGRLCALDVVRWDTASDERVARGERPIVRTSEDSHRPSIDRFVSPPALDEIADVGELLWLALCAEDDWIRATAR